MREIKFRVYSTIDKPRMIGWDELYGTSTDCLRESSEWKVMQFTGLLDKNGVEIFESDIIIDHSIANDMQLWKAKIIWLDHGAWGVQELIEDYGIAMLSAYFPSTTCEVIGNIYENRNLLNGY